MSASETLPLDSVDTDLPEGWAVVSFMDVFDIQGGTQPPKTKFIYEPRSRYVRLLQIRDFGAKPLPTYIPQKESLKTCFVEDILIGRYGASVGRICTGLEGAYNVALTKVIIPPSLHRRFVFWLLQSEWFQKPILEIERSAQNGFNKGNLERITVPLCPIPEQHRIVARIDRLFQHINRAREQLNRVPTIMKRFRQAVLAAACSGGLTADWRETHSEPLENLLDAIRRKKGEQPCCEEVIGTLEWTIPDSWRWTTLSEIAEVVGGITKGQKRSGNEKLRSVPYLRVANVQRGFLDLAEMKCIEATEGEIADLRLVPGDILFTEGGDRDKLGRGWVWSGEIPECIHQNHIFRARLYSDLMQGKFVSWFGNLVGQSYFIDEGKQTVNLASINLRKLRAFPVPIPPPSEQKEIVRRVEALFKLADAIEKRVAAGTLRAEALTQAILAEAFRGELVPTEAELARREGRSYESAVDLLARIQSERAEKQTSLQKEKNWPTRSKRKIKSS